MPFSAVGAIWFLYLLGYNMSIGVWVGLIALLGVDAETGVLMLLYLDMAYGTAQKRKAGCSLRGSQEAILDGAVKRIRPKFMTVADDVCGADPDHVVDRHRSGCNEAHRRSDDRRDFHVIPAGAAGVSGNLRGLEMALRSQTAIGAFVVASVRPQCVHAAADQVTIPVRHTHLRKGGAGELQIGALRSRFVRRARSRSHSREWAYEDIQQLYVAPDVIRILTYEDVSWKLGSDREYEFDQLR